MHQRKSKKILVYFFLLLIFSTIGNKSLNNFKFQNINNIQISGINEKKSNILLKKINDLKLGNIFFINEGEIRKLINSSSFIETYEIYKNYPSSLNIKIKKAIYYAKMNDNGKIFIIGSNGKLIADEFNNPDLPFIFGKPDIQEFIKFKKKLDKSNFAYTQVKNLYFFPTKRWDLKFKNNTLLRLPYDITPEILNNLHKFLEKNSDKNLSIVDARINNQIILNE